MHVYMYVVYPHNYNAYIRVLYLLPSFRYPAGARHAVTTWWPASVSWSSASGSARVQVLNYRFVLPGLQHGTGYHCFVWFQRRRLDSWWFGVPLLCRGPLLSLPVVLATDYPPVQIIAIAVVLAGFMVP